MAYVSQQDFEKFFRELQKLFQRVGGGKVGVDIDSVRSVVRSNKAAAYHYVEFQCIAAASQPGYLQPAIIVAGAYQVEFDDETLVELVLKRAKELNAMEHLESMGFASNMAELKMEPPERETARQETDIPIQFLQVQPKDLKNCDIGTFINLFSLDRIKASGMMAKVKLLKGKCAITFPLDDDPRHVIRIPSSRRFTQELHRTLPHLPYFLSPIPELGALHAYFGCLIDENLIIREHAIDVSLESFIPILLKCTEGIIALCELINDDARSTCNDAFSIFPKEMRNMVMQLMGVL